MLPILRKSMATFNTLRAQFSQLVQFFNSIVSLIVGVMGPSVKRLVDTLSKGERMALAGVTLPGERFDRNFDRFRAHIGLHW
jgi:hypothetical protein